MGKRSNFCKVPKDLYRTIDPRAVPPVLPFVLSSGIRRFIEPCYGYGDLPGPFLRAGLECVGRYDVAPRSVRAIDPVVPLDGRSLTAAHLNGADAIITNPPWTRDLLHALIARWVPLSVCWLLFDAAWKHTRQAAELMRGFCTDFVPTPRLIWIPGTTQAGKDDCGWYRFDRAKSPRQATKFWPLGQAPAVRRAGARPGATRSIQCASREMTPAKPQGEQPPRLLARACAGQPEGHTAVSTRRTS